MDKLELVLENNRSLKIATLYMLILLKKGYKLKQFNFLGRDGLQIKMTGDNKTINIHDWELIILKNKIFMKEILFDNSTFDKEIGLYKKIRISMNYIKSLNNNN